MTKKRALYVPSHDPKTGKPSEITRDMVNLMNKKQGYKFRIRVKIPKTKTEKFAFFRTMDEAEEFVKKTGSTLIEVQETDLMPTYKEYEKEKNET